MSNTVPNRVHNSGKSPKRKLRPQQLRARRDARRALIAKLTRPPR